MNVENWISKSQKCMDPFAHSVIFIDCLQNSNHIQKDIQALSKFLRDL